MRRKELRIALVCYGGISLAVYMHGVTKEVWHLARASMSQDAGLALDSVEQVYARALAVIRERAGLRLAVLPDILAGASAGGMNSVFLAQAIQSGQSLEPLTRLWLERADIDWLLDPRDGGWSALAKQGLAPFVRLMLRGEAAAQDAEIRAKLTRLIRARWFEAPFSGIGFSRLIAQALDDMAALPPGARLLPQGHPLDLFTTATDCTGQVQRIALGGPAWVEEREHRVSIDFRAASGEGAWADFPELVFAARATASFPGAFPPLQVAEIDRLMAERGAVWPGREAFLARVLPSHVARQTIASAALMDGSVLVNAPFGPAIAALSARPAHVEVDRRLVYIDPTQSHHGAPREEGAPGFFPVIFRALSTIPREQPIRDNLDLLARQSAALARVRAITAGIQGEIDQAVRAVMGDQALQTRPDARLLGAWRAAAQQSAAQEAGYAYHAYALFKLEATLDNLAQAMAAGREAKAWRAVLGPWAQANLRLTPTAGVGLSSELVEFLRAHDGAYRQRRMRHVISRLEQAREACPEIPDAAHDAASGAAWAALSLTLEPLDRLALAPGTKPGAALRAMAKAQGLAQMDQAVDAVMAQALAAAPLALAQRMMLAYLGFAYFDAATLALTQQNDLAETAPVRIDRISPMDWQMGGEAGDGQGLARRLKGENFHQFGAFFSRAYREHDYLIGRLQGAARMLEIVLSASPVPVPEEDALKRAAFAAILREEAARLTTVSALIPALRRELGVD